jgi:hypothetical protein
VSGTKPEDDELEQLLADSAGLRRRYRASSLEEPPAALDAAILAAARREVNARPRLAGSPFGRSWRVPLSIAAVVVVSATVTLMVAEHTSYVPTAGQGTPPVAARTPETSREQTEPASVPQLAKKRADNAAAPSSAVPPALQNTHREARRDAQEKLATPAPKSLPAQEADHYEVQPFPAQAKPDAQPPSAPAAGNAGLARSGEVAATGAVVPGKQGQLSQAPAEKQEALKDEDSRARLAQPSSSAESKAKDGAPLRQARPSPPSSPAPEKSTAGAAAPPVEAGEESAQTGSSARKEAESLDALHWEAADAPWTRDPQAWLEHVKQLQAAGRIEEAKASYKAFRTRYPDYRLPAGFVPPAP